MNNFFIKTFTAVFLLTNFFLNLTAETSFAFPETYAEGIYIMDGKTGQVLYEKNGDVQYEPASTTKVMTAIIALENCTLDEKVTIGENPPRVDGSAIGLAEGEVYTIEELLLGLLLESGNDCAEAIAEHIAGSNAAFGEMMTERAKELGATNTTFKNPSGLPEEGHLTTAHDLSLIMQKASEMDELVRISRVPSHKYENHPFSDGSEKWVSNKNPLLREGSSTQYPYIYSGKTGYTIAATHCYTAASVKDDQIVIASFLKAENKDGLYNSVVELFDWAFDNFETTKIVSEGDVLGELELTRDTVIPLKATEDVYYTFSLADNLDLSNLDISIDYEYKDFSKTSISNGEILFNADLLLNGSKISSIDLASGADREYTAEVMVKTAVDNITNNKLFVPTILIALAAILILILIIIIINIRKKKRYLMRRSQIRKKHNLY